MKDRKQILKALNDIERLDYEDSLIVREILNYSINKETTKMIEEVEKE